MAKRRAFPGVVGRPSAGAPLGYRWLLLAALAALAVLINQYAPTVFFDSQLMLGSSVAVLALLLFGWSGLLVGAAALAVTVVRWGHPFELLIGMGLLIWLRWFLDRLNGGPSQYANGRIVLAAIGYWLLIGIPAEILLFLLRLGVDPVKALGLGLKEAVASVLSVALGLVAYVLFTAWRYRGRKGQISARGITFATVLLAVSLPGVLITIILSSQLRTTALQGQLQMALANLIRNALEALSLAGVAESRLRLSLHHHQDAHGSTWLELRLADNGPGFSDLQLEQLLLASTKPQGSGLGLFVVNAAVQIHGGSVQLGRSAELGGAEVLLRLPALAEPG